MPAGNGGGRARPGCGQWLRPGSYFLLYRGQRDEANPVAALVAWRGQLVLLCYANALYCVAINLPPGLKGEVKSQMKSRIGSFLLGVVVGAALLHVTMNYHFIRSSDGFHLVAKRPARLSESFVDVRDFSMADWTAHPQLASALVQANKQHLLGASAADTIQQSFNQLLPDRQRQ
jgi:hypothetical protein